MDSEVEYHEDETWAFWWKRSYFGTNWTQKVVARFNATDKWQDWLRITETYRDRFGREMPDTLREQLLKELL